jgi:hypothetical protein
LKQNKVKTRKNEEEGKSKGKNPGVSSRWIGRIWKEKEEDGRLRRMNKMVYFGR